MNGLTDTSRASLSYPDIRVGGIKPMPLASTVLDNLAWTTVDLELNRPDMFEIAFLDLDGTIATEARLSIGTTVEIWAADTTATSMTKRLIVGEVTSIEAICDEGVYTVFRGYDLSHRMQRVRATRTYVNMSDAEIARKIARTAGLKPPYQIMPSVPIHQHIAQVNQTDWDFLKQRAREIGYETGVENGTFFFRKAPLPTPGGKAAAKAAAMAAKAAGRTLIFKENLLTFHPRISGANMTSQVEVRVWDPYKGTVVTAKAPTKTGGVALEDQPDALARSFKGPFPMPPEPPKPPKPGINGKVTPPVSNDALVVVDRLVGDGLQTSAAANVAARSIAEHLGSSFYDAEGVAIGDPDIKPGAVFAVERVPDPFLNAWTITGARHTFNTKQGGYQTHFYASGTQDRSLLGLTSNGTTQQSHQINGLVCGVVTNVHDVMGQNRVKVAFPWLDPDYESDWARVAQFAAGPRSGAMFLPEVGDEVLVGFELGDLRRPYVIGGILNSDTKFSIGGNPVKPMGAAGEIVWRGFADSAGNKLAFHAELPPRAPNAPPTAGASGPPPLKSEIVLGTVDEALMLSINETTGMVTLKADPKAPRSQNPKGTITIDAGLAGMISIKTGPTGQINVEGGTVNVTAKTTLKVESTGPVQVKGNPVQIN